LADLINAWGPRYRHVIVALDGNRGAKSLLAEPDQIDFPDVVRAKGDIFGLPRRLAPIHRRIGAIRPSALLTFNFGSIEWALANRLRRPVGHVHFEEGFGVEESPERQIRRRVWLRRAALAGSHTTTVVVSHVLADLAGRVWRLPESRVVHVPNGIHLDRFSGPRPERTHWRTDSAEILVAVLGGLRPEKNVARLIRAMARLVRSQPNQAGRLRLIVAGDGPERGPLESLVEQAGLIDRVQFIGFLSRPEDLLAEIDILAVSSDHEQMPLSVMEAMAAGLPIVSTDVGDIRSMVAKANHPYIAALDQSGETLANAFARLIANRAEMREIGTKNAVKAARDFGFSTMADTTSALIDEAANLPGPSA
jgi:glycosyltransferase involved in cell wall biosynthesis